MGLQKDSSIFLDALLRVETRAIIKKVGRLEDMSAVNTALKVVFGLNEQDDS